MHPPQECEGVRVYLLGRFEVKSGDRVIIDQAWPRRKAKALIKQLALNKGGWLHREQLVDTLWPELEPAAADHNFRQNLHYLRQAFGHQGLPAPVLTAAHSMVGLDPDTWVDVAAFREAHQAARRIRTDPALYESALELYGGDLLPEDIYEDWTQSLRDELRGMRRQLLFELAAIYELRGQFEAAARQMEELVRADPLDEEAHRGLIRLYAETGNRQRAQRQYERCRDSLEKELGVGPSEETAMLYQSVLAGRFRAHVRTMAAGGAFIGRRREMTTLIEGLERAMRARGEYYMLAGEAGIGKTRTAEELAMHAHLRGAQVMWGRCYEGEGASAYWPWIQVLRAYIREHSVEEMRSLAGSGGAHIASLLPELDDGGPVNRGSTHADQTTLTSDGLVEPIVDAEQTRFRLFDSVGRLLSRAAERQPLVLILDDVHRADASSLQLLNFLACVVPDSRLFLLGTYRDSEVVPDHALSGAIAALERGYPGHIIRFEGLERHEVGQLMEASTGQTPSDRVAHVVCDETGGNPFLVQELSRALATTEMPERLLDSPGWGTALPRGAQALILHGLQRLSSRCRQVLTPAAVAGREFESNLLQRLGELDGIPLHEALEEAVAAHVVVPAPGNTGHFSFRHGLIREALYGQLPRIRRAQLHKQVGEALERIYEPETDFHAPELAYHFLEAVPAGSATTAVRYAKTAAERSMALFAYEDAARMYQRTLDFIGVDRDPEGDLRCELLLSLGQAKWDSGDPAGGREAFQAAAALARLRCNPAQLARAALGCGRSLTSFGSVDQPLVDVLEEALRGLPDEETALRAMVMASLARALYWSQNEARASFLSREAVRIARRGNDQLVLAQVLDAAWVALWAPENPRERLELATELVRIADGAGDKARAHQGHRWRMISLLELGDTDEARREFAEQVRIAQELRHPAQLENASVVSAMWALFEGRLNQAEQLASEAMASASRAHDSLAAEQFGAQTIALLRERGRLDEIEPVVRAFAGQNPAARAWLAVLAWIHSQQGREPEAQAEFDCLAANEFAGIHRDYAWLMAMSLLADVCSFLGDRRRADVLYRQLVSFGDQNVVMGYAIVCSGSLARSLGSLAATMRRWRDAQVYFEAAMEMNERMGARTWLAWTQYDYARMLTSRSRSGDAARAACLMDQALATARELEMTALEAKIKAATGAA